MYIQGVPYILRLLHKRLCLRYHIRQLAAVSALPLLVVALELVHGVFDLGAQIGAVKAGLVHDIAAILTVPSQSVLALLRPGLFDDDTDRVREPDGVVRRVGRQEEHVALVDVDVPEVPVVDDFEQHAAPVLVEPFGRLVDVVVCSRVRAADDLGRRGRVGLARVGGLGCCCVGFLPLL